MPPTLESVFMTLHRPSLDDDIEDDDKDDDDERTRQKGGENTVLNSLPMP